MNFLFTTVLVLLLVAPGLLFFSFYHSGRFSIRYSNLTVTEQVLRSIVPGLLLQAVLIWVINRWQPLGYQVRLDVLGVLLLGAKSDATVKDAFLLIQRNIGVMALYETVLLSLSAVGGWAVRQLVRYLKLDRRTHWFRYDNEWHYLLTGEILETYDIPSIIRLRRGQRIDFVLVDALVKLEDGNMLYSGVLAGYELAADGGLRTIYLHSAQRKILTPSPDEDVATTYHPLVGELLTLPYSQLLNLNISYFLKVEETPGEDDNDVAPTGETTHISVSLPDEDPG